MNYPNGGLQVFRRRGSSSASGCDEDDQHRDDVVVADRRDRHVRFNDEQPFVLIPDINEPPTCEEVERNWFKVSNRSKDPIGRDDLTFWRVF